MKTVMISVAIDTLEEYIGIGFPIDVIKEAKKELVAIENGITAMEEALYTVLGDAESLYSVTALDGLMDIIGVCKSTLDNIE